MATRIDQIVERQGRVEVYFSEGNPVPVTPEGKVMYFPSRDALDRDIAQSKERTAREDTLLAIDAARVRG